MLKNEDQNRFAICVNNDLQYIGNVQLTDIIDNKAQFHIFIGEKGFWNKGIGTEATLLMIKYGFENLKLHKIYLLVNKSNVPAIKSYEKCGFRICGIIDNKIRMEINKG